MLRDVELAQPLLREIEQSVQLRPVERPVLAGALHFDERVLGAHHNIHIDGRANILLVVEIETRTAIDDTDAHRDHAPLDRRRRNPASRDEPIERVDGGNACAGDRRRARATVRDRARRNRA